MWERKKKRIEVDKSGRLHIVEVDETEVQAPEQTKQALNPPLTETVVKPAPAVEKEAPETKGAEHPAGPRNVPVPESSAEPTAKPSFLIFANGKWYRV